LGQLASMTRYQDPAGATGAVTATLVKDSLGQLVSLQEPASALQTRTYSGWAELLSVDWSPPSPEPPHRVAYTYDALGRMVHSEEQNGALKDPETLKDCYYDAADPVSSQVNPTNLKGRLAYAAAPTGDVYFSYDGLGFVNARTFTDSSSVYYVEKRLLH